MNFNRIKRKIANAGLASLLLLGCSEPAGPASQSPPANRAPVFLSSPITEANENNPYEYRMQARDPNGDPIAYEKVEGPGWLSVVSNIIYGTPPEVPRDSVFPVRVKVYDSRSSSEQSYNLTVRNIPKTYVLSQTQLNGLAVDDTSLSFSQPVNFLPGDIIGSGISTVTPSGILREVNSVSSDGKTIRTTQASLEQVTREASLSFYQSLSPSGVQSFSSRQGVMMSPSLSQALDFNISLNNVVLYDNDGNPNTTGDQIIANGNIAFNTGFNFDLDIKDFTLNRLSFQNTIRDVADITIGSNLLGLASTREIKIADYKFNPVVVGFLPALIPVPIVVTPQLGVYVGIDPSRVNPLSIRVNQDATLTTKLEYDGSWHGSANFVNNFDFSLLNPTGEWDLTAYAGPRLNLLLYGVGGPSASVNTTLRLESTAGNWKLYGGLEASLGVYASIFSHRIASHSEKILGTEVILAQGNVQNDGKIVYVSDLSNNNAVITTVNPDGTNVNNLTSTSKLANYPVFSPDKREIAYSEWISSGRMDIKVLGSNPRTLTSTDVNVPGSWSPDGSKIVMASSRSGNVDIYTLSSSDGSGLTRLTTHSSNDRDPVWSSDNWIYFVSERDGNPEIYKIRPTGSDLTRITNNPYDDRNPNISPDGTKMIFDSNKDGDSEIYLLDLVTGNLKQLTNNTSQDYDPCFSPSGNKVAFVSNRSGSGQQVYTMDLDGLNQNKITSKYIDDRPNW